MPAPAQPLPSAERPFAPPAPAHEASLRAACQGVVPLAARLEPWMLELFDGERLHDWVERYGSPLNVLCSAPLEQNIRSLNAVADDRGLDFRVYYARKANKSLQLVDTVARLDGGVDTASLTELTQTLAGGVAADRVICTAAIKDAELLTACVTDGVTVAIDNADELLALQSIGDRIDRPANIALRVSGFRDQHTGHKLPSRFGIDIDQLPSFLDQFWPPHHRNRATIVGLHFHLHGGSASQRVAAISQLLPWVDRLRNQGHPIAFMDIGGGFPINYQSSPAEWERFWQEHNRALLGERSEITRGNHGLGRMAVGGQVHGTANVYPYHRGPLHANWLASILDAAAVNSQSLAKALCLRQLQLRCEPGRSVLDGCGVTVARVEYHKPHVAGYSLLGLAMNRTQCRTTDDDLMVDPILLRRHSVRSQGRQPQPLTAAELRPTPLPQRYPRAEGEEVVEGYLVGATCTECESILQRRLRFDQGVGRGDLVVFPNTAGYWMHFMESRSHQFPLAKNLLVGRLPEGLEVELMEEHGS